MERDLVIEQARVSDSSSAPHPHHHRLGPARLCFDHRARLRGAGPVVADPVQQFGLVTAITIGYALVAAIVVVPPSMIVWAVYQTGPRH